MLDECDGGIIQVQTMMKVVASFFFLQRLILAQMLARYGPQMSGSVSFVTNNIIIIMQYVYIYTYINIYIHIYNINEVCS